MLHRLLFSIREFNKALVQENEYQSLCCLKDCGNLLSQVKRAVGWLAGGWVTEELFKSLEDFFQLNYLQLPWPLEIGVSLWGFCFPALSAKSAELDLLHRIIEWFGLEGTLWIT